jgi:hypothetical protein
MIQRRTFMTTACLSWAAGVTACAPQSASAPGKQKARHSIHRVGYWKDRFDSQAKPLLLYNLPKSRSRDSYDYYNMAYGLDGFVSMFEATGLTSYLDIALRLVDGIIGNARASSTLGPEGFHDGYLGWVSQRPDVLGQEVQLFESFCWRYVCRLLTSMKRDTRVYDAVTYRDRYDTILGFTENNISDKWYERGATPYIYQANTHMASHWAYISLHLRQHTLDQERRKRCDTITSDIDSVGLPNYSRASLKSQMHVGAVSPGAVFWNENWGQEERPGSDVNHGNAVVSYIAEGHDYGTTWTSNDIADFSTTLTNVILPKEPLYVDGTGRGLGALADGFVKLGRFEATVQASLEKHPIQNGQYMAAMAENARRLGAR